MPPKGAEARGHQIATLAALEHRLFTSSEMRDLVAELAAEASELSLGENDFVRETAHDLERAVRLPESLVHRMAQAQSRAYHAWVRARSESAFGEFLPHLAGLVALAREKAECLGYAESLRRPAGEVRAQHTAWLRPIFDTLPPGRAGRGIVESPPAGHGLDGPRLGRGSATRSPRRCCRTWALTSRQGARTSVHPSPPPLTEDVRVTTRVNRAISFGPLEPRSTRAGTPHEQGFPRATGAPSDQAKLPGHAQSQSRLWRTSSGATCRSGTTTPQVRSCSCAPEDLSPSRCARRTASSRRSSASGGRVTTTAHHLRFEIETALIEGSIEASMCPNCGTSACGSTSAARFDDARGCLQDIHYLRLLRLFPDLRPRKPYAAQLLEKMEQDMPQALGRRGAGGSGTLGWLRTIHAAAAVTADSFSEVTESPDAGALPAVPRRNTGALRAGVRASAEKSDRSVGSGPIGRMSKPVRQSDLSDWSAPLVTAASSRSERRRAPETSRHDPVTPQAGPLRKPSPGLDVSAIWLVTEWVSPSQGS